MTKGLLLTIVLAFLAIILLSGCAHHETVVRDRTVTVDVPVPVPCVKTWPDQVPAIRDQLTPEERAALDVRQRAALVGRNALSLRTYGEQLYASTGGCK